jgi:Lrp/AsnC family transcriptional regulator, leucine-responsive regulatory protein
MAGRRFQLNVILNANKLVRRAVGHSFTRLARAGRAAKRSREMNRSRYVNRPIDGTDRAIIAALATNGRMTIRELAGRIELSGPSVADRIRKMEDSGAIAAYTIIVDPEAFGLHIPAYLRVRPMNGELQRVAQLLADMPEVIEVDRVTGEDCIIARVIVAEVKDLSALTDRILPFSSTTTAIIQSSPVKRRIPATHAKFLR